MFQSIIDALQRGEKIELRGFGSFRLRKREPRKGRNPKTGDKVDVPPKNVPYFKPGKELKDLINKEPLTRRVPKAAARGIAGQSRTTRPDESTIRNPKSAIRISWIASTPPGDSTT